MRAFISQQTQLIRAYYGGIGKTAVIFPAAFLVAVAMGQLTLGIVLYARSFGDASRTQVGALAGVWSATYIVGCLFLRPLFGRVLPRFLVMGSTLTMAVLVAAMTMAGAMPALFGLYAAFGLALSLFWPPMMGWMSAESDGPALGRVTARFNLSWSAGNVISPFLCGWLSERNPLFPLFLAAILLMLVFAFVAGASIALPRVRRDAVTGAAETAAGGGNGTDGGCALRYPAWIGLFGSFFALGCAMAVLPLAAQAEWGIAETAIGLMFTGRGLTAALGFVLLGRIHAWHYRHAPILAAQWLTAAVFAALALTASALPQAGLLAVFGVCGSMTYAASIFHGAAGGSNRARRMAIHESVLSGGLVAGSAAGGWLYERMPSAGVFFSVALFLAGLTIIQTFVARRLVMPPRNC